MTNEIDDALAAKIFEASSSSYHLILFFSFFNSEIMEKNGKKDLNDLKTIYDKNWGRLLPSLEEALQKEIK
jgi:hypothetical protein